MSRDIEPPNRQEVELANGRAPRPRPDEPPASRDHDLVRLRGYVYRTSPAERILLNDIGRFRAVGLADLAQHLYRGDAARLRQDLGSLRAQGLIQTRTFWSGPRSQKLALAALTKQGKKLLESGESRSGQTLYAGFVKPAEVRHDAAIYRMYQAEKEKIERAGGRIGRVVLDFEFKQKIYAPLAKARSLPPLDFARRQAEVAQQNGLKVIEGKTRIAGPSYRIRNAGGRSRARRFRTSHRALPRRRARSQGRSRLQVLCRRRLGLAPEPRPGGARDHGKHSFDMSQIPMTEDARVRALARFGYSEPGSVVPVPGRPARRLLPAPSVRSFTGGKDGGNVTQFVQKTLTNGHLRSSTWRQGTQLYHLCSRPFYEAIGRGENRNRRPREVLTIKNKLMGLDFVLAHLNVRHLATEQEKLDYFTGALGLDSSCLPSKLYRAAGAGKTTTRYFLDKYPVFTFPAGQAPSPVPAGISFCYVDEGTATLSRFESYLKQYGALLTALPAFCLIYVAAEDTHFKAAQRQFETF